MSNVSAPFDYLESRQDADELIAEFGQAGAIRCSLPGQGGDPWNPSPSTETDHPCTLVVLEYTAREMAGTLIRSTDKKVLVAAGGLDVEPSEADRVVVQGNALEIVNVSPLSPAGVVVLFELQARS